MRLVPGNSPGAPKAEWEVLVAGARANLSAADRSRLVRALTASIDWEELLELALWRSGWRRRGGHGAHETEGISRRDAGGRRPAQWRWRAKAAPSALPSQKFCRQTIIESSRPNVRGLSCRNIKRVCAERRAETAPKATRADARQASRRGTLTRVGASRSDRTLCRRASARARRGRAR